MKQAQALSSILSMTQNIQVNKEHEGRRGQELGLGKAMKMNDLHMLYIYVKTDNTTPLGQLI